MTTGSFKGILLIGGPIGSGKTWTADRIAPHIPDCARSTFSSGLRRILQSEYPHGVAPDVLQDLGNHLAMHHWEHLWEATLAEASSQTARNVVIDGIRHPHIVREVRKRYKHVVLLVLAPSEAVRMDRIASRDIDNRAQDHPVERGFDELARIADVVLRGDTAVVSDFRSLAALIGLQQ